MHEASSLKIKSALLVELLKSRRVINDQVLGKLLFNSMSMHSRRLALAEINIYVMQEMEH